MPDENENNIAISELDEALDLTDSAQFPYTQNNGGTLTTFKARLTQIAAKIIEGLSFAGINLPTSAGDKTVENSINFLLDSVGGDPNGNISDSYDPTAAYVKGDLCIYENVLYICTAPTTGTFDPSNWTATTIDSVIGSLSTLTTTEKSSIVGAVNEVNNLPNPTLSIITNLSGVTMWNTSYTPNTRAGTINVFFIFDNQNTTSPTKTHKMTCTRPIRSFKFIAYNAKAERSTDSSTLDSNNNIAWGSGLTTGVWLVMGTVTFT